MIMGSEPDWAYLPVPALCLILEKLLEPIDHIWFGGVCKQWQSVSTDYKAKPQPRRKVVPMLMIHTETKSATKRSLYSVGQRQIYNVQLPVLESKRFCGSSHGWLATLEKDLTVTLFNPFKSSIPSIHLPPTEDRRSPSEYSEFFLCKLILSADPISAPDDYVVLGIRSEYCNLIYFKPGFKSWRQVGMQIADFTDIIFYEGLVYAVSHRGMIICFDVNNETPKVKVVQPRIDPATYCDRAYLVESSSGGNLFYVQRYLDNNEDWRMSITERFRVYKLRLDNQIIISGEEVKSLDGDTLFVGDNYSVSVSAANFPGLQQNSIYFTHDYIDVAQFGPSYGPHDVGVFNVENGSFGEHYTLRPSDKYMAPTIWIMPPF